MVLIEVQFQEDDDFIDDFDLICLLNKLVFKEDPSRFIVWDALYTPNSDIERKIAYDMVRREKMLRGFSGPTRNAMNLAAGELRHLTNDWVERNKSG